MDARRAYEHRHREQGLCLSCGAEAAPGRVRCRACLDADKARQKARYQRRKQKEGGAYEHDTRSSGE